MESSPSNESLENQMKAQEDWYRALIFDTNKKPIAMKNVPKPDEAELSEFLLAMNDRDTTIGKGFRFNGYHFDVHRYHVPLVYGRRGGPEESQRRLGVIADRIDADADGIV